VVVHGTKFSNAHNEKEKDKKNKIFDKICFGFLKITKIPKKRETAAVIK
jgi:hypothetical protein